MCGPPIDASLSRSAELREALLSAKQTCRSQRSQAARAGQINIQLIRAQEVVPVAPGPESAIQLLQRNRRRQPAVPHVSALGSPAQLLEGHNGLRRASANDQHQQNRRQPKIPCWRCGLVDRRSAPPTPCPRVPPCGGSSDRGPTKIEKDRRRPYGKANAVSDVASSANKSSASIALGTGARTPRATFGRQGAPQLQCRSSHCW